MPLPAAIASDPSTERSPFNPIARNTSGSHSPSEAEMTCGLKPRFCSGAVSARSVADGAGLGLVDVDALEAGGGRVEHLDVERRLATGRQAGA